MDIGECGWGCGLEEKALKKSEKNTIIGILLYCTNYYIVTEFKCMSKKFDEIQIVHT